LQRVFNKIRNSQYLQNFIALAGSELFAQAIQIGVSPILTRIYSPIDFGQYELFKSICLLFIVIGFLQFDVTIYSSKTEKESINSISLCIITLTSTCLLAFLGIFIFNDFFLKLIGAEVQKGWSWTLPVYVFFSGLTTLLLVWMTKAGSFFLMSKIKITVSILVATTQISFGYMKMGYWGLIYSTIIVQIIAFSLYFYPFFRSNYKHFLLLDFNIMRNLVIENWRLPSVVLPGNFLNYFVQTLPVFFLGRIDTNVLGYFSLARRIIDFPLKFITAAVQQLYIKEITDEVNETGVGKRSFDKNLKLFSAIAFILFLGILVFTKPVLPLLFGKEWTPAIPYIIILGLLYSVRFIFGSLGFIMVLGKAPKLDIFWQVGFCILIISTFRLADNLNLNSFLTIFLYVFASVLAYLMYGLLCKFVAKSDNILNTNSKIN